MSKWAVFMTDSLGSQCGWSLLSTAHIFCNFFILTDLLSQIFYLNLQQTFFKGTMVV